MLLASFTAFGLSAASKTDLVRYAESQRQASVAAILCDQLQFVAGTGTDTNSDGIDFSPLKSLVCFLAQRTYCTTQFYTFESRYSSLQTALSQNLALYGR